MNAEPPALFSLIEAVTVAGALRRRRLEYDAVQIAERQTLLRRLSEAEIRERAQALKWLSPTVRQQPDSLIAGLAVLSELATRVTGLTLHRVQLQGALALARGGLIEMQTGEGKTLTALLPTAWSALSGHGCHVHTANDYLAARDEIFARPFLAACGLRSAVVTNETPQQQRPACYAADVTYGTEKEFGFDFLRDQLRRAGTTGEASVQRPLAAALIDEADSLLIDQARTPLVISLPRPPSAAHRRLIDWSRLRAGALTPEADFHIEPQRGRARLTRLGERRISLFPRTGAAATLSLAAVCEQVERALTSRWLLAESRDYLVLDGQVEIVDAATGRVLPGRKWSDGLQQAVERDADVELSPLSGTAARITLQRFYGLYPFLCGMSGTISDARREMRRVFGLSTVEIPPYRASRRTAEAARLFGGSAERDAELVRDVQRRVAAGRAVLIGASSVTSSERLGQLLRAEGLPVEVLHARAHQAEATIIAEAGASARVTVATNIAGRGADIRLSDGVRAAGGLHVVLTELNRSRRADRQLIGRGARQGDPGSWGYWLSLDDELLEHAYGARAQRWRQAAQAGSSAELPSSWRRVFAGAQRRIERADRLARERVARADRIEYRRLQQLGLNPYLDLLDR